VSAAAVRRCSSARRALRAVEMLPAPASHERTLSGRAWPSPSVSRTRLTRLPGAGGGLARARAVRSATVHLCCVKK
jgi:hypothetical protein